MPALPPRDVAPRGESPPGTPGDVHTAATAPDARRRLGDVREGSLHALEAYRFFSEKLKKRGSLSPEEQAKFERAKGALTEEMERAADGSGRPVDAEGIGPADSPPARAAPRDGITPSDENVHAAATAPDARRRLGDVRAGSLHALEAYRFFSEKLKKKGSLSPEEQAKFDRAKRALAEAIGGERQMRHSTLSPDESAMSHERSGIAASPPDAIEPSSRQRNPAHSEDIDDPEEGSYLSERHGKRLKKALELPQDASRQEKKEATQLILDEINRKSRYLNPRAKGGGPLMRGIKRPELFNADLTLTPEERMILRAPHEVVVVFGPDGRLKKAGSDFHPQQSGIPEVDGAGNVVTHQHPSGLPPSFMDLVWLIERNPAQIHRTAAEQKNGSVHLFEMRVNGQLTDAEVKEMKLAYEGVIRSRPDSFETRMLAIELTMEQSNGKLQFKHKRIP